MGQVPDLVAGLEGDFAVVPGREVKVCHGDEVFAGACHPFTVLKAIVPMIYIQRGAATRGRRFVNSSFQFSASVHGREGRYGMF